MEIAAEYEDMFAFYRRNGLGGRVGFGAHPALLVVDLVCGFTDAQYPLASNLDTEVEASQRLLAKARESDIPILFSTVAYDDATDAGVWMRKIPANEGLIHGSPQIKLDPRLQRRDEDPIVVKKYASCFFGTDLVSRLLVRGVDTLLIAGCTTSGCVRASAVDACSYGFHTIVVQEAVGDRAQLPHMASLFDIDTKYGDVVSEEDATKYLQRLVPRDDNLNPHPDEGSVG